VIHPLVKLISVDGFFSEEEAKRLSYITDNLQYEKKEIGREIPNFNMVPDDANAMFSNILDTNMEVDEERSGVFRYPDLFIHFEEFDGIDEWVFVVALQESTFNVFEHKSGAKSALDKYKLGYQNLFEWDLQINYVLKPGQGVLFRPWIFHSFNTGLIQVFRLKEKNDNTI
jgi:hypothetical protein